MDVEITNDHRTDDLFAVLEPFATKTLDGINLSLNRRSVPYAEQVWTDIRMNNSPEPFSFCGLLQLIDIVCVAGQRMKDDTTALTTILQVMLTDNRVPLEQSFTYRLVKPCFCDAG